MCSLRYSQYFGQRMQQCVCAADRTLARRIFFCKAVHGTAITRRLSRRVGVGRVRLLPISATVTPSAAALAPG